jgi:hypothetical protein
MTDSVPLTPAVSEHFFSFETCYARLLEDQFILGNEQIEHRWKIKCGLLSAGGARQRQAENKWKAISQPAVPHPTLHLPPVCSEVYFWASGGPFYAQEPPILQVVLRIHFAYDLIAANSDPDVTLIYRFQIVPGSTSLSITLENHQIKPVDSGNYSI